MPFYMCCYLSLFSFLIIFEILVTHSAAQHLVHSYFDLQIQHHGEFCVTFNKKFSSFALFESKVSAECSPYQTSMKYHGRKHDKELLTQMRTWLPNNPLGNS